MSPELQYCKPLTLSSNPIPLDDTYLSITSHLQEKGTAWKRSLSNLTHSETRPTAAFILYNRVWLFYSYL
jgi:hypothetical protein